MFGWQRRCPPAQGLLPIAAYAINKQHTYNTSFASKKNTQTPPRTYQPLDNRIQLFDASQQQIFELLVRQIYPEYNVLLHDRRNLT